MSNNAPDYNDDLVFPPHTILTPGGVIRVEGDWSNTQPHNNTSIELVNRVERLQKQLDIAIVGLQYYANEDVYIEKHQIVNGSNEWASEVMLDNGVKASYFLKKIQELNK